jgi:hypothetical protein
VRRKKDEKSLKRGRGKEQRRKEDKRRFKRKKESRNMKSE